MAREFEHGVAAVFLVDQHAVAVAAGGDFSRRLDRQHFEVRDTCHVGADPRRDILELDAMVAGQRHQRGNVTPPRRCPMDVVDRLVLAQR